MYIYGEASVALWRQKLSAVSKAPDLNKPGLGADSREWDLVFVASRSLYVSVGYNYLI
jgi:hypothetical protein